MYIVLSSLIGSKNYFFISSPVEGYVKLKPIRELEDIYDVLLYIVDKEV